MRWLAIAFALWVCLAPPALAQDAGKVARALGLQLQTVDVEEPADESSNDAARSNLTQQHGNLRAS
jgi:hypothetical protein